MRRIIGALAAATLVGAGAVALTTGAAAAEPIRSVEFTGTSVFDFATPECSFAHQVFDATLATHRGDSLHIDGCTEVLTSPFTFTGTFVLDSPGRHDVTGTVSGFVGGSPPDHCAVGFGASLDFELTPTTDTGRPSLPLQLDGTWCSPMAPGVPGPISGTLTGALPPGTA
jgi:hypothetical protein